MARRHLLNRDKIHTIKSFSEFLFHAIPVDREEKSSFLGLSKGLDGISMTVPSPVFDLKKDGDSIFSCNNINLSSLRCDKIRFHNLIPVFLEVLYGKEFCLISNRSRRNSHKYWGIIPHLPYSYP